LQHCHTRVGGDVRTAQAPPCLNCCRAENGDRAFHVSDNCTYFFIQNRGRGLPAYSGKKNTDASLSWSSPPPLSSGPPRPQLARQWRLRRPPLSQDVGKPRLPHSAAPQPPPDGTLDPFIRLVESCRRQPRLQGPAAPPAPKVSGPCAALIRLPAPRGLPLARFTLLPPGTARELLLAGTPPSPGPRLCTSGGPHGLISCCSLAREEEERNERMTGGAMSGNNCNSF
jgi:hypothetical protein